MRVSLCALALRCHCADVCTARCEISNSILVRVAQLCQEDHYGKFERRSRPDRATAKVVKVGLNLAERDGRPAAAAFMDRSGVPFRVIVRVLSDPTWQRRY